MCFLFTQKNNKTVVFIYQFDMIHILKRHITYRGNTMSQSENKLAFLVVLKLTTDGIEKEATHLIINAESQDEANSRALECELNGELGENASFISDEQIEDMGGDWIYDIKSSTLVKPEHIDIMRTYLHPHYALLSK